MRLRVAKKVMLSPSHYQYRGSTLAKADAHCEKLNNAADRKAYEEHKQRHAEVMTSIAEMMERLDLYIPGSPTGRLSSAEPQYPHISRATPSSYRSGSPS